MTGFARQEGANETHTWCVEMKSINGRTLDIRFRLPPGFDAVENAGRKAVAAKLKRGTVSVALSLSANARASALKINRALLDEILALYGGVAHLPVERPRFDGLLALKGVIENGEEAPNAESRAALEEAVAASLAACTDSLFAARAAEGAEIAAVLAEQLNEMERLVGEAQSRVDLHPEARRERLQALLGDLLGSGQTLPEERIAHEVAMLLVKNDIREEIDRLKAHIPAARGHLAQGGAVGRQLDFLCQELNREANTLCSKAGDIELTRIGLALKTVIDQFREQVQNLE
jgi:uncharacterized protein (TIGR00255 family)